MRTLLADTYEQSHQHLCAVAAKYVGPDAEDVVQDVFVRALQSGDAFRFEAAPSTWLHRIVVNSCIDRWRRRRAPRAQRPGRLVRRAVGSAQNESDR